MTELKRVLDYKGILLITINSIMGTGIFFLPALGAQVGGSASIISWAILSIIAIYISMVFAELCSMFPNAGGVYEFCKQAYGRFVSFCVGWITLIVGYVTISMLVVGAIQYLLPYSLPWVQIPLALFFIVAFNYIAFKGMKTSATMLIVFAIITMGTLAALIIPNIFKFQLTNIVPIFSKPGVAIYLAIFFIVETFFGWESSTFLAGEVKDGQKIMPRALIVSTIIIALISLVFVVSSLGVIPAEIFGQSTAPLQDLGKIAYGDRGIGIFTILAYLAILGSVASWIVASPRLILSMAKDKLFLRSFAKIHPKNFTPYKAIFLQTIVTSLLVFIGFGSYTTLLALLVPMALIMYSFVMISLIVLRYKKPKIKRYYKVPFYRVGPILVVLFLLSLIFIWVGDGDHLRTLGLGIAIMLLGIPMYFLIEMYYDPRMVRIVDDFLAYAALYTERFGLPMKMRKEIMKLMGNIKGKVILEFGCSVGTMTMHLAEEVGPSGKIYATNFSKRELNITKKRVEERGHKHVNVIHDLRHHSRVHPTVPKIHSVISVGTLGYLQNTKNVLTDINKRMKIGSKICFVDYDKFFDVIPNIEWLSNDKQIVDLFKKAGFNVKVKKKQAFAWKYILVYGTKVKNVK